jgi:hypothetical protein
MSKRRAGSVPWNGSPGERKRGRPAKATKVADRRPLCIWPARDGICGKPRADGLAVCPEHALVLNVGGGDECAWPPCSQFAPWRALCPYHLKVAKGLLAPAR